MATALYQLPMDIRRVDVDRSGQWLAAGWRDFLRAPGVSLLYGGAFTVLSILIAYALIAFGLGALVLPLTGGFVLLAPILVVGLYDVSRSLEQNREITLGSVFAAFRDNIGQLSAMGIVLLILWFVWVEIAIVLFAVFFGAPLPALGNFVDDVLLSAAGAPLLIIGTLVGAAFATVIFTITAVSIPMMYDRPVDIATAIAASVLAVRANWQVMFGWAALIALVTVCAVATFFIGLAVALPVLAYATWHSYRDLIEEHHPVPAEEAGFGAGI